MAGQLIDDCSTVFAQAAALGNHTLLSKDEIKQLFEYFRILQILLFLIIIQSLKAV